ncbi:MAG: type I-F CRISPR-associated endoribonuclease Cas6/Csy4 [Enterobacteriaceae bacterium]
MKSYVDIRLVPDTEFTSAAVLEKLWYRLHHYIVESGARLAVSFPGHHVKGLGDVMRVHGESAALVALVASRFAKGVYDYIDVGNVSDAPADAQHCVVSRAHFKTNAERIRRRAAKRGHDITHEKYSDEREQKPDLPYCRIFSKSSQQMTYRFIRQTVVDVPMQGEFDTFGLSRGASVPFF